MVTTKSEVIQKLKVGIAQLSFYKKDGSIRDMVATLDENLIPASTKSTDSSTDARKKNDSVLSVWDTQADGWRSFQWSGLISVDGVPYKEGVS